MAEHRFPMSASRLKQSFYFYEFPMDMCNDGVITGSDDYVVQ